MEDERIVLLYWDRDEAAISESSMKYGAYCTSIAQNILKNPADAEECVNDTWLHAWNAMPPHRPSLLSTFLGKITRNLSFDLYRKCIAENAEEVRLMRCWTSWKNAFRGKIILSGSGR